MAFNPRKALDTIVPTKQAIEDARRPGEALEPSREEILNYTFRPGQVVKDRVTGKEVKILAADRGDYVLRGQSGRTPE